MSLRQFIFQYVSANPFSKKGQARSHVSLRDLRLRFSLFFFALAIPSAIISYTAFEKLQLESTFQHQQAARSITLDVNSTLTQAIIKEESRLDTDYSFLIVEGEPDAKFLQRSVLSRYPIESNFPGTVGYFQVDPNGRFSSPLLPNNRLGRKNSYGLSDYDLRIREQLEQDLYEILAKNKLVTKKNTRHIDSKTDTTSNNEQFNQSAFDLLASAKEQENISREVEEKKGYKDRLSNKPRPMSELLDKKPPKPALPEKPKKTEKSYLPQQDLALKEQNISAGSTDTEVEAQIVTEKNLNVFESELDPFRFSLLKSGHFVVYRKVWRDERQFIQGAVLSIDDFFEQLIKPRFEHSPLSDYTQLSIAYGNSIMTTYPEHSSVLRTNTRGMDDDLYMSANLTAPFNQISLIFNATDLPASESGRFIMLMTVILVLALVFGTYALFRLTYRQSSLAQQHQDFVSSVSHELKTPITSIQMYGEILKKGWLEDTKRTEYYDFICSESERLSRLISNILQISKVSRNSLNLDIKEIAIHELASLIDSKVGSQIKLNGFTYHFEMNAAIRDKTVKLESDAFIQIMINLVDNAIKYSRESARKQIDITFDVLSNNKMTISVRDYGIGIKADENQKVFELFYRIGNELTRKSQGTGIGLALVKALTDAMDGKIMVVNHSEGTEFILTFMTLDK